MTLSMKWVVAFVILILLINCSETEVALPDITVHTPGDFTTFQIFDSIHVQATISAENTIEYVSVSLVHEDFSTADSKDIFEVNQQNYSLDDYYHLDDIELEDGSYYLLIEAITSVNSKKEYIHIQINGIANYFKGVIVIAQSERSTFTITQLNSELIPVNDITFTGDMDHAMIMQNHNLLMVSGINSFDIKAFQVNNLSLAWERDAFPSLPLHQGNCFADGGDIIFLSYYNDYIRGFNSGGEIQFNASINPNDLITKMHAHGNYLIADQQSKNQGETHLITYQLIGGNELQRYPTNFKVIDFFSVNENEVLIFFQADNSYGIILFEPYSNSVTTISTFNHTVASVMQYNADIYHFVSEFGFFTYNLNSNTITETSGIGGGDIILHDKVEDHIIIIEGNNVHLYHPVLMHEIAAYVIPGQIRFAQIIYGREIIH